MKSSLIAAVAVAAAFAATPGVADPIPSGWTASSMTAVGYTGLDEHASPFKLSIKQANGRWYLYTAHSGKAGLSIVDVTDPAQPKYLKYIPGPDGTSGPQVTLHGNLLIWGLSRPLTLEQTSGAAERTRKVEPEAPADKTYKEGVEIYDISDPADPKFLSRWEGHAIGTHRNGYPGGNYAFLTTSLPGYSGNVLLILDVSDPK